MSQIHEKRAKKKAMIETKIQSKNIHGEFVVKLIIDGVHQVNADYYTDDREDAEITAAAMLQRKEPSDPVTVEMPSGLTYWTADEVAECLPVGVDLYRKLWEILSDAKNPTPMGGDGSIGTVETPDGRYDPENDDKTPHWWSKLAPADQAIIRDAYRMEAEA